MSVQSSIIPPVGLRQWLVAISASLTLAFTAWGLGGVETWTLHVLSAGGMTTFLMAVMPLPSRDKKSELRKEKSQSSAIIYPSSSLASFKRLARWPFFWLSFLFLIYLLIGAMNPAVEVVSDERGWWVQPIKVPLATWLPTSVRSDYEPMNAWRVLQSFTGAFALAWGMWAGITRRKPVLLVLWVLLFSGAGMAFVAILQHLSGADAVLWTFPSSNENFWGSFFYRNQGAAYLNLILVLSAVLFFYHGIKARQKMRSGGPHFLCFFLFILVISSVALALSRGGILFGVLLSLVFFVLLAIFGLTSLSTISSFWMAIIPVAVLSLSVAALIRYVDFDAINQRFGDVEETIKAADRDARYYSSKATWDMAEVRLAQGWGAGSFRYVFPMYQREYPEIYYANYHVRNQQWKGRRLYRYAHNDILQFVAEYGLVGTTLVFGALLLLLFQSIFHSGHQALTVIILVAGAGQAFAHAFLDFIFNSPAYWMALTAVLVLSSKLLCLEHARSSS